MTEKNIAPSPALTIVREFDAPRELVFDAFSDSTAMAQWWGPAGFRTTVLKFDFRPGGVFHYKFEKDGQVAWGRFEYGSIHRPDLLEFVNSFADEHGAVARAPWSASWPLRIFNRLQFAENQGKTVMTMTGYPLDATPEEQQSYGSMIDNMQQGFDGTFAQLDQYLSARFRLSTELKKGIQARTSSYLNFPGNTEEAFLFYRSVFRTDFNGRGFQRFGDIAQADDQPPVPEGDKHLILHVELPLLGGHVLMATDAPASMGFTVQQGNNMHICLEPETREETKRIFEALSEGGTVTMPLQDMFWGAYYGSFTDRYGVNWMVSFTERTLH